MQDSQRDEAGRGISKTGLARSKSKLAPQQAETEAMRAMGADIELPTHAAPPHTEQPRRR